MASVHAGMTMSLDGVEPAIEQAKAAIMLGAGLPLFDGVASSLEKISVQEVGARTSLAFRVRRRTL